MCWCLSIIELKNARWNIEICWFLLLNLFVCLFSWDVQLKWQFKRREFNRWGRLQNGRTGAEAAASLSPASGNVVQWLRGGIVRIGNSMHWYWMQLQWWLMWGFEMGQALMLLSLNVNETVWLRMTPWRCVGRVDVLLYALVISAVAAQQLIQSEVLLVCNLSVIFYL